MRKTMKQKQNGAHVQDEHDVRRYPSGGSGFGGGVGGGVGLGGVGGG